MSSRRDSLLAWTLAILLVAVCFVVYVRVAANGFISMDDDLFIYKNTHVLAGVGSESLRWALTSTEYWNWYPLTRLTHLADSSLFGMWAGGHHLASVAWHAAAAGLLLAALWLLTGGLWRSGAAAAFFAVHPLNVQAVAWAAERSMVLGGFFFSLTLLLWVRHLRRPATARYLAALAAFLLGLAAKPVLVTLPCVLLLLDGWPLGRLGGTGRSPSAAGLRRCLLEKAPFFLASAASALLTLAVQWQGGAVQSKQFYPVWVRFGNAALAYWRYLGKILWPANLALLYPHEGAGIPLGPAVAAALLLAALTAAILVAAHARPWLAVGWLWFVGMLVPMIGLVQVADQSLADRYAYLPSIGVFVAAVWFAAERLRGSGHHRLLPPACLVVTFFGAATLHGAGLWRTGETLYTHTLAVTSENPRIENNLANELFRQGRLDAAIPHYRRAVTQQPTNFKAHFNFALALAESGQGAEAEMHYREALRLLPQSADAHWYFGVLLERSGRPVQAQAEFREARRLGRGIAPVGGAPPGAVPLSR